MTPNDNDSVLAEQVGALYSGFPALVFINVAVGSFFVYGLWQVVPVAHLLIWMACLVVMLFVRYLIFLRYKAARSFTTLHQRALFLIVGSFAAGLVWGLGGLFLFPEDDLTYQLFVLFILVGMGSGSSTSLASYLPAYYAFFPASILPIAVKLFTLGDSMYTALGAMAIVYLVALTFLNRNVSHRLTAALMLRHENKELVQELRLQKEEAEKANRAKSQFLAAASHDLRQPLHALTLFTQTLADSVRSPSHQKLTEQILTAASSLSSLFNALLDISQLDAGAVQVNKTTFSLQKMFDSLCKDFLVEAELKGLGLSFQATSIYVYSDIRLVNQVLRNYISNAIRYTSQGSVRVHCDVQDAVVVIHVSDTGLGIDDQDRDAIFEEFYQLGNSERNRSKGLGLGLAIVKHSANLLGYDIAVESTLGKGSTFSVSIELATEQIVDNQVASQVLAPLMPHYQSTILIIDDDVDVLTSMQGLLELWGCNVLSAIDIDDALIQLQSGEVIPDGLITDYRLPNQTTGLQAIKKISELLGREIPTLILTGDTMAERVEELTQSQYQVLYKPISPLKLRAFLQRIQPPSKA